MLNKFDSEKGVVLIGGSSEIGLEILNNLRVEPGARLVLISRNSLSGNYPKGFQNRTEEILCDLESIESVNEILNRVEILDDFDLVILATGYLPRELNESDLLEVQKTQRINGESVILLMSAFANRMTKLGGGKLLLISSVASIRPRIRNFTYGASKAAADFFALGLANKYRGTNTKIRILRPGFVFTKMTKGFDPAPFAVEKSQVARIAVKAIRGKAVVTYAPVILKLVMNVLRFIPRRIFNSL
jgi:decaprenylphospho-beta-D-erythro-pentofuranosid-2-ulose 2-reductase